ncbi:hypothetical protein COOONC_21642 [Cooperia oncophora]
MHSTILLLGVASSNYSFLRCDRYKKHGGGILLLIRNIFSYIEILSDAVLDGSPSCSVEHNAQLLNIISDLSTCEYSTVILGDFNYPEIDWVNYTVALKRTCSSRPFLPRYLENMDNHRICLFYVALNSQREEDWQKFQDFSQKFDRRSKNITEIEVFSERDYHFPNFSPEITNPMTDFPWFDSISVFDLLRKLPCSQSVTPHFIPSIPTACIFDQPFCFSEVPLRWKHSFITFLLKKNALTVC